MASYLVKQELLDAHRKTHVVRWWTEGRRKLPQRFQVMKVEKWAFWGLTPIGQWELIKKKCGLLDRCCHKCMFLPQCLCLCSCGHTHTRSEMPTSNLWSITYFTTHFFLVAYSHHTIQHCFFLFEVLTAFMVCSNLCKSRSQKETDVPLRLGCLKRCVIEGLFIEVWARVRGTVLFWVFWEEDTTKTRSNFQGYFRRNINKGI